MQDEKRRYENCDGSFFRAREWVIKYWIAFVNSVCLCAVVLLEPFSYSQNSLFNLNYNTLTENETNEKKKNEKKNPFQGFS